MVILVLCLYSWVGSMVQSQRIFSLASRCIAEGGGLYIACRRDLHSRDQHQSISPIGLTRFFDGLSVRSRFFSVDTVQCGMVTKKAISNGLRGSPMSTPPSTLLPHFLSLPTAPSLPCVCSPENLSCQRYVCYIYIYI